MKPNTNKGLPMLADVAPGKNVLMVVHEYASDVGSLGLFLDQMGVTPLIVLASQTDFKNLDAAKPDIVVVMGGPMGVYEADQYPWITDEVNFIARRIAADKPLLGVCLGSQMIASALGANVYKGKTIGIDKEIGWHPVTMNAAGKQTPLLALDKSNTPMVTHWHGDTFDLPKGATLLGSSDKYPNQAYSYGKNVMAVQFHPEMTAQVFERWMLDPTNELPEVGLGKEFLNAQSRKFGPRLLEGTHNFFNEWVGQVSPATLVHAPKADNDSGPQRFTRQYAQRLTP